MTAILLLPRCAQELFDQTYTAIVIEANLTMINVKYNFRQRMFQEE